MSRRLTLDYGVRFYHDAAQAEVRGQTAAFVQGMYNPANAPVLITSGRNAASARVGVDPLTGKQYNIAFIGTFAPGHGDPSIGMVAGGTKGFPHSPLQSPGSAGGAAHRLRVCALRRRAHRVARRRRHIL